MVEIQCFITYRINKMLEKMDLLIKSKGKNLEDQQRGILESIISKRNTKAIGETGTY